MANQPGRPFPRKFRANTELTAQDLRTIVSMLIRRLEGGKGVNIRTFGNRVVIEADDL